MKFSVCYLLASCVSPTLWPQQMARSRGRRTWGPCYCPAPQQLLPATLSKCPSSLLGRAFKTFAHLFFSCFAWKDLYLTHPSLAEWSSKLKTNRLHSASMSWCSQTLWEAGSWYMAPLHNHSTEKLSCLHKISVRFPGNLCPILSKIFILPFWDHCN